MCVARGSKDKCPHCGTKDVNLFPYGWGRTIFFKCSECGNVCNLNKTLKYEKLNSYTEKELRKNSVGACENEVQSESRHSESG